MTIYEELGVPQDASEEEIQKSLRALNKMLHPDLHEEAATRRLAEAQLKRLNGLVAALSDKKLIDKKLSDRKRRSGYDAALGSSESPTVDETDQGRLWLACIVLVLGLGYCLWQMVPEPAVLARSTAELPSMDEQGPLLLSSPNRVDPVANPGHESKPLQRRLEGVWRYAMNTSAKPARWAYSADFVELKIEERKGELFGAYRSRYQIPDAAKHRELSFRFHGPSILGPSTENQFIWAVGNLKGRIEIRLETDEVLKVSWRIEDEGTLSGLKAGSATLTRRQNSATVRR